MIDEPGEQPCGESQPKPLDRLTTESANPASARVDTFSALEIARLMNAEDAGIAAAVAEELDSIAVAIEWIADAFRQQGRLIYIGAGTSGRLGVLDASECPPTFRTDPSQVVGLIAGGQAALTRAIEGAEDSPEQALADLQEVDFGPKDVLVGIASSGRTPYVIAGLEYGNQLGARTVGLVCNAESQLGRVAQLMIAPVVGPEIINGSTRMKAGTATKMVLNMLTTGAMIRIGKTYGNLMVDLRATNSKLVDRSTRIVAQLTGLDESAAAALLARCDGEVKTAIVMSRRQLGAEQARDALTAADGRLREVIDL